MHIKLADIARHRFVSGLMLACLFGAHINGLTGLSMAAEAPSSTDDPQSIANAPAEKSPDVLALEKQFSDRVLPLLKERCFECHSHEHNDSSGELMLDSLASMLLGGTRGTALVPGDAANSLLLIAIQYADTDLQMPPSGKLSDDEIAVFEEWLQAGANVPDHMRGAAIDESQQTSKVAEEHWAYIPPQRWEAADIDRQPIDQLIDVGLKSKALTQSPPADRGMLVRRLSYDLIGLPPTLEDIAAIQHDARTDDVVIAELIDRLLESPQFGERWARYWMDVSRYADTKGYVFQEDREYPGAYQYRDWLINAFNADMPYDEFVSLQLAADLLSKDGNHGNLPALGFLTLGRRFLNNQLDIIDDRLDVVSRGLMGMTLGCARCHDHKYDPISQADYYSMSGVFLNTDEPGGEPWPHRLKDSDESRESFILVRGSPGNRGDKVDRRFVSFLAPEGEAFSQGSGRVELAREIVSADNPLTARVMANRIWMRLTGASLVESPSDLGTRCPPPVQLALLDYLATSFVDEGWSMKRLIRQIALSKTYQQQSLDRADGALVDPENSLYWRMNRRRLDFEAFRDTLLSRAQLLDATLHGPSQKIDSGDLMRRRTVYAYIDRQNLPSVFRTFDFASPDAHNSQRALTSVPQQGLFVLNSQFVAQVAAELGRRALEMPVEENSAAETGVASRVQFLFASILARQPSTEELQLAVDFLSQADTVPNAAGQIRWICGFGKMDPTTKQISGFQPLPAFIAGRWQASSNFPDESLGYLLLTAEGGHVGRDLDHAVIRRWVAPRAGTINVRGKLKHNHAEGDGVRGSILVANVAAGDWIAKNSEQATAVKSVTVQAGDAVDFVSDCIGTDSHDSFQWTVRIRYTESDGEQFVSKEQHPVPRPEPLDRWSQLAQILLATNELAYVD